jgi:phosphopantothenoylcysteine decarboxylase/phosphopantothenate--cysteine ligase
VNEVGAGRGFEVAENAAVVLDAGGGATEFPHGPKDDLADVIWDIVATRFPGPGAVAPGR